MLARAPNRLLLHRQSLENTLAPFLYCTRTILRGYADSYSNRPPGVGHIPFEGLSERHRAKLPLDNTTITPREREAFENLLRLKEGDEETISEDATAGKESSRTPDGHDELESILSTAAAKSSFTTRVLPVEGLPPSLYSIAEEVKERRAKKRHRLEEKRKERKKKARRDDALLSAIDRDFAWVSLHLRKTTTDTEIWEVLQTKVLDRVRALQLDGPIASNTAAHASKASPSSSQTVSGLPSTPRTTLPTDLQILTTTLPRHLVRIHIALSTKHPGSPYTLALLPTLKALGPVAFALGATTNLYNLHLAENYSGHPQSLHRIISLLEEMETEVYPFDPQTYRMLRRIVRDADAARRGQSGPAAQVLWSTDRMRRDTGEIYRWIKVVEKALREQALKAARAKAAAEAEDLEEEQEEEAEQLVEAAAEEEEEGQVKQAWDELTGDAVRPEVRG